MLKFAGQVRPLAAQADVPAESELIRAQILRIELVGPVAASVAAVGGQEVTLRSYIGDGGCKGVGPLMLEAEAPVDVLRRAAAEIRIDSSRCWRACRYIRWSWCCRFQRPGPRHGRRRV